jgi:UDP-N-acetylglucosamine transferase subunit ALG13
MILVITDMDPFQFDRVVKPIDELAGSGALGEEVFIQLGSCTYVPKHCKYERFLSFAAICEKIGEASVVITHAGAGSTLNCIHNGKHPVIVPRLARHQEVVDDHQIPFAERLDAAGAATMVIDLSKLVDAIAIARQKSGTAKGSKAPGITRHLESIWQSLTTSAGSSR